MVEYIHNDLMSSDNREVKFDKVTDRKCPTCGHGDNPNMLFIRTCIEMTVELECKSCGYTENRPISEFPGMLSTMPEVFKK